MQRLVGIVFVLAWLLCGCSIDTFFDGGAPVFLVSLLVVIICAMVLSRDK